MLTKRTNILFEEDMWEKLVMISLVKKRSVGDLVRTAVNNMFFVDNSREEIKEAVDYVFSSRKVSKKKIDYKSLINEGRKY